MSDFDSGKNDGLMGNNRTATCLFTSDCAAVLFLDVSVLQQSALFLDVSGLHSPPAHSLC
jgi:hypothetical protein